MPRTNYASGEDGAKIIMYNVETKGAGALLNDHDDDAYLITPCSPSKVAVSGAKDGGAPEAAAPAEEGAAGEGEGGDRDGPDGAADGGDGDARGAAGAADASAEGPPRNALAANEGASEAVISKYFVVELVEEIVIDAITIANYEFYSSGVHEFDVYGSSERPVGSVIGTRTSGADAASVGSGANGGVLHEGELMREGGHWVKLNKASFVAENNLDEQTFTIRYGAAAAGADGDGAAPEDSGKVATNNSLVWAKYLLFVWKSHHGTEHYCTLSKFHVHGLDAISAIRLEVELARLTRINLAAKAHTQQSEEERLRAVQERALRYLSRRELALGFRSWRSTVEERGRLHRLASRAA